MTKLKWRENESKPILTSFFAGIAVMTLTQTLSSRWDSSFLLSQCSYWWWEFEHESGSSSIWTWQDDRVMNCGTPSRSIMVIIQEHKQRNGVAWPVVNQAWGLLNLAIIQFWIRCESSNRTPRFDGGLKFSKSNWRAVLPFYKVILKTDMQLRWNCFKHFFYYSQYRVKAIKLIGYTARSKGKTIHFMSTLKLFLTSFVWHESRY